MNNPTPNQIKQARLKAGLTQARLSQIMGVNVRTIGKWENNERPLAGAALVLFNIVTAENPANYAKNLIGEK